MKLYITPGGIWCGNEADWKAAVKAENLDPKKVTGRKTVDVPTAKPALMDFLNFYRVGSTSADPATGTPHAEPSPLPAATPAPVTEGATTPTLDALFDAAPLRKQLDLAMTALVGADRRLAASE